MIIEAVATGKTVDEAKEAALKELPVGPDADVQFEVVELAQKKKFGLFGGNPAKVRAFVEIEDEKPRRKSAPKKKPEKPVAETPAAEKKVEKEKKEQQVVVEKAKRPGVENLTADNPQVKEAETYLVNVLTNMGVTDIQTEIEVVDDGVKINFNGNKLGVAIGRKGDTLDALQHLTSLVANKAKENYIRVTLNPGGYRQKREETLVAVAKKSADKALKSGRNVILEPMNSYERRIIHNCIQEIGGELMSWSIGENEHRRVCIGTSKDNKPYRQSYDRRRSDRRGRRPARRPSQTVESKVQREPLKDSADLPMYGKIK